MKLVLKILGIPNLYKTTLILNILTIQWQNNLFHNHLFIITFKSIGIYLITAMTAQYSFTFTADLQLYLA